MKRTGSKLLALGTALALAVSMTAPALAAPGSEHATITKPKANAAYYIGDSIPLEATLRKYVVPKYGTVTQFELSLRNVGTGKTVWSRELTDQWDSYGDEEIEPSLSFPDGKSFRFSGKQKTAKLAPGKYAFQIKFHGRLTKDAAEICDESDDYSPSYNVSETASVKLALKLKKPAGLKAAAGKKKVTVSWKKVTGAKKYEVYRSAKKSKGYTKVATTAKLKITDRKKLKKGKKYYYKVRAVNGKEKSAFTGAKRSGKVK